MSDPMSHAPIPSESNPTPPAPPEVDVVAKNPNVPLIGIIVLLALLLDAGMILLLALLGGSAGGKEAAGTSPAAGQTATVQQKAPQDAQAQKQAGQAGAKQPAGNKSADQKAQAIAVAKAQGKQVFEGTIRILNHAELVGFQGAP